MLLVLRSMSGAPETLPVGEPCGDVEVGGGGCAVGAGGCVRVIVGAGGGGGGGEVRTNLGRCAAEMLARRLWKEAAEV